MELHIKERLYFAQLLPTQNTFLDFTQKKEIMKKVSIRKEEIEKFEIKEDPETKNITWNVETDIANPLNVDFTAAEIEYIKKGCESISDRPCPDDFWALVEKFYNANN